MTVHLHRLLCWAYCTGRQQGALPRGTAGLKLAAHLCGRPCCLSRRHMEWCTAAQNTRHARVHVRIRKVPRLGRLPPGWEEEEV